MKYARQHKYRVAPKAERTWNGIAYDSKAEMMYAQHLDILIGVGDIESFTRQARIDLDGIVYKPDFVVTAKDGSVFWVDVKGVQTPAFKIKKKLWQKHGPGELHIVERQRHRFTVKEIVQGKST